MQSSSTHPGVAMNPLNAPPIVDIVARTPSSPHPAAAPMVGYDDLDASIEPMHADAPVQEEEKGGGWLAPLIFLLGLFIAFTGVVVSAMALAVVAVVGALMVWMPASQGMDAEYIIVPETLPVEQAPANEVDAEFIIVPETLPTPEASAADDKDAMIRLQALPVDEAIQRVTGKAGRGEARSSRGQ